MQGIIEVLAPQNLEILDVATSEKITLYDKNKCAFCTILGQLQVT